MTNFGTLRVAATLTMLGIFNVQAFCAAEANGPTPPSVVVKEDVAFSKPLFV